VGKEDLMKLWRSLFFAALSSILAVGTTAQAQVGVVDWNGDGIDDTYSVTTVTGSSRDRCCGDSDHCWRSPSLAGK
jgi:hypothetical protein